MATKEMKNKVFILSLIVALLLLNSCGNDNQLQNQSNDVQETAIDSLAVALHEIDSIMNGGELIHVDIYEIGKLKNVYVSVQKMTAGKGSSTWINFRKDCGGEYYYSWEDAHLLDAECKYLIEAINTILSNKNRNVDHEERYAYITKDDIRIFAGAKSGNVWSMDFSVDYRKQNSSISLNDNDIEDLKSLIQRAQEKIMQVQ